jgi:hypothetical protein
MGLVIRSVCNSLQQQLKRTQLLLAKVIPWYYSNCFSKIDEAFPCSHHSYMERFHNAKFGYRSKTLKIKTKLHVFMYAKINCNG